MKRTRKEIAARAKEISDRDPVGTEQADLVGELGKEHLGEQLLSPKETMKEYMEFAFGKAHGERGLSASRSMAHFAAWLWLDGNEELAEEIREFEDYGLENLRSICEYLEIDPQEYGDE